MCATAFVLLLFFLPYHRWWINSFREPGSDSRGVSIIRGCVYSLWEANKLSFSELLGSLWEVVRFNWHSLNGDIILAITVIWATLFYIYKKRNSLLDLQSPWNWSLRSLTVTNSLQASLNALTLVLCLRNTQGEEPRQCFTLWLIIHQRKIFGECLSEPCVYRWALFNLMGTWGNMNSRRKADHFNRYTPSCPLNFYPSVMCLSVSFFKPTEWSKNAEKDILFFFACSFH